jgi:hypothetical protein
MYTEECEVKEVVNIDRHPQAGAQPLEDVVKTRDFLVCIGRSSILTLRKGRRVEAVCLDFVMVVIDGRLLYGSIATWKLDRNPHVCIECGHCRQIYIALEMETKQMAQLMGWLHRRVNISISNIVTETRIKSKPHYLYMNQYWTRKAISIGKSMEVDNVYNVESGSGQDRDCGCREPRVRRHGNPS